MATERMPPADPPPPNKPEPKGQLKFRDDVVPWLDKKRDQIVAEEVEDPLKWEKDVSSKTEGSASRLPAIVGGLALAAVVAGTIIVIRSKGDDGGAPRQDSSPAIFKSSTQERAEQTLQSFLAAETIEDKLALVAWPEKTEIHMREYYRRYPDEKAGLEEFQFISSSPSFETDNTYYLAASVNDGNMVLWVLLDEGDDGLKIDWECLVAYSEMPLPEFIAKPPQEAVAMRLVASPVDYFNDGFTDDQFNAFALQLSPGHPDQPTAVTAPGISIFGYTRIGSTVDAEMLALFSKGKAAQPVHVLLAPAGRNVCLIEKLIRPDWSGE